MASAKTPAKTPATLYAGKLPSTKRPGETPREKVIRRALRAAKALDVANAKPAPREGEREGYAKKFEGTLVRLRERIALDGITDKKASEPTNEFERAAFALAGIGAKPEAAKKAPAKRRAPAKKATPEAAPEGATEGAETALEGA